MSPFDIVKKLFTQNDVPVNSPFMVNRILSFMPETFELSIRMNRFATRLPPWAVSACYNLSIPKRRRYPYMRYAKKGKTKEVKLKAKIRRTFCVNEYHANQIIELYRKLGEKPESYYGLKEGE